MNRGWIPVCLDWRYPEPTVRWCHLGQEPFSEPFFDSTVQLVLQRPFNALFAHETPIGSLEGWHERSPGLAPSGFIFHMSRCGSTLVSQMLAALPRNVVVSEAGPLDSIARA